MVDPIARATRDTVGDALRRAARRFRDRTALRFADRSWSFAELDRAADRVARALLAAGLSRGDRVVAYGRNSDGYLLLWLGCARAGLVHVPANYALTAPELGYIVGQCGARALFHDPALSAADGQDAPLRGHVRRGRGRAGRAGRGARPVAGAASRRRTRGFRTPTWSRSSTPPAPPARPRAR